MLGKTGELWRGGAALDLPGTYPTPKEIEMLRKIFLSVATVTAFAAMAMPAVAAKGGNSTAAKLCQKGGWENLVRADQTPFTSAEDCSAYGGAGGTPAAPVPGAQSICQTAGYTYAGAGTDPYGYDAFFTCSGATLTQSTAFALALDLQAVCDANDVAGIVEGQIALEDLSNIGGSGYTVSCIRIPLT